MANELTISGALSFQKGTAFASMGKAGIRQNVVGAKYSEIIQEIGTSAEALLLGDIGTPGYVMLENLDATNFVSLRSGAGGANFIDIPAGSVAGPFKFSSASNPFAIANTAAARVRYLLIEA